MDGDGPPSWINSLPWFNALGYSRRGDRYDQETFIGRFAKYLDLVDPRTLMPETFFGMTPEQAVEAMDAHDNGSGRFDTQQMWMARKIRDTHVHPHTGEELDLPWRLGAVCAIGVPLTFGLTTARKRFTVTLLHVATQTYLAAVAYHRCDAACRPSFEFAAGGAAAASVVAVSTALAIGPARLASPLLSTLAGSLVSIGASRYERLTSGWPVTDEDGAAIGDSHRVAAFEMRAATLARVTMLSLPLTFPQLVMSQLDRLSLVKDNFELRIPLRSGLILLCFCVGLPLSFALFNNPRILDAAELEDLISLRAQELGIRAVYYSREL